MRNVFSKIGQTQRINAGGSCSCSDYKDVILKKIGKN